MNLERDIDPEFPFQVDYDVVAEPVCVSAVEHRSQDEILRALQVTPEEAHDIALIPQGTPAWLTARKHRLTASNFGAAAGMNKYKTPNGLLKDMLWNSFTGNAATRWGSAHEHVARAQYVDQMQREIEAGTSAYTSIRVEESGLHVNPARPWLGSSPDGVVHVTTHDGTSHRFLLEIKCPFRKVFYEPAVPLYYLCQIQGVMANMELPYCDFVVWTPRAMQITRVAFDEVFWTNTLLPKLDHFYFQRYLPLVIAKHNGQLEPGSVVLAL